MKKMLKPLPFILLIILIGSCTTQNGFIQKRKYQNGYHLSLKKRVKSFEKTSTNNELSDRKKIKSIDDQENTEIVSEEFEIQTALLINEENTVHRSAKNNKWRQINAPPKKLNTNRSIVEELHIKSFISKVIISKNTAKQSNSSDGDTLILLYILAILIPFVAVGIVTDWDITAVLINLLLTFLCYIPGVIHAFIKIRDNY